MTTKRIVYTQSNGLAGVVTPAPKWLSKMLAEGNTEAEAFEILKVKSIASADERATAKIAEDESAFPPNRKFRDAWAQNDTQVVEDMDKARLIHMNRIREVRNSELAKEDINFQKAIETDDPSAKTAVVTKKQILRDIPQTFDLSGANTGDELDAMWPSELPARTDD
jgi:hypothetical protein